MLMLTGGNGFLGHHIRAELDARNVSYLAPHSAELNILDFDAFDQYLRKHKPDTILALAAKCAGILGNHNNPAVFLRDNTQMALNTYEAARVNGITNIYSVGSICAYPSNCPVPFREDNIWNGFPEKTNAPYSQAKRTLMMLGQTYRQQYGMTGAHLIPVNMYGAHDKFDLVNGHVIPSLIIRMENAKREHSPLVECFGSGTATREFLFGPDCAEVIIKAVFSGLNTDLPINLGVGKDISIRDLACLIAELIGFRGEIVFNGTVSDGQKKRLLDVSRAKEMLGWQATTGLREGLIKTIEFYRSTI